MANEKVLLTSNFDGTVGVTPAYSKFAKFAKKGVSIPFDKDEIRYIFRVQSVIQNGLVIVDDKDLRVEFGLETAKGEKQNMNVLTPEEIVKLINGSVKNLEKALKDITEEHTLRAIVETAREQKVDSKVKIDLIEKASKLEVFPTE